MPRGTFILRPWEVQGGLGRFGLRCPPHEYLRERFHCCSGHPASEPPWMFNHGVPGTRARSLPHTPRPSPPLPRFLAPLTSILVVFNLNSGAANLTSMPPTPTSTVIDLVANRRKPHHQPSPASPQTITNLNVNRCQLHSRPHRRPHDRPSPTSFSTANLAVNHRQPLPTSSSTSLLSIANLAVSRRQPHR
jgi:hypothetical protein